MSSLHKAAQEGRLDECRRLVEKEGKDANEHEVLVWFHQYASIETGQHISIKQTFFIVRAHNTKTHFVPWCFKLGFNHQHHCVCLLIQIYHTSD
jgi:hypothetical protein